MGFRFRKSINLGGGFKVNLSKSGVGYSWGTKGVRYTKTASGKKRTTLSIPGTGISYVTESGNKKKVQKKKVSQSTNNFTAPSSQNTNNGGNNMAWFKFVTHPRKSVFFSSMNIPPSVICRFHNLHYYSSIAMYKNPHFQYRDSRY